ncbi:MAG: nucleoside deaminase [Phycisphaerales bacterium]|nr:nucleoside deaminase [Phycisphaerales bacterium]
MDKNQHNQISVSQDPTATDLSMMDRAIKLAAQSAELGEVPVGALVYETETGAILANAHNTREMHNNPAGHAEFSAILDACKKIQDWRLNHCTLVVTLEPCPMCAGLIVNSRIGRLVFGASDPKAGAVRSLFELCDDSRLNHRCEIVAGVHKDQCSTQLSEFFRNLRKQPKSD